MRRRPASGHTGGGKRLPQPSHSFTAVPDGRIQLTPSGSRLHDVDDFSALASTAYEDASTPTLGSRKALPSSSRSAPAYPRAPSSFSRAASYTALNSSRRHPAGFSSSTTPAPSPAKPPLSARALSALNLAADALFSLCLAAAAVSRANLVSLYYLLVLCYGAVFSLQSRATTLTTLLVALLATAGHVAAIFLLPSSSSTLESVADLFGFSHMTSVKDYALAFGPDTLVLVASTVHLFYTLRRLKKHKEQLDQQTDGFDFFEMGEQLFHRGGDTRRDRMRGLLQSLDATCAVLLLVAAVAVPAFAPAVFYLLLIERLARFTLFAEKVSLKELAARVMAADTVTSTSSRPAATARTTSGPVSTLFGLGATRVLLLLNVLFISLWYLSQLNQLRSRETFQTAAKYCGFADFRADDVHWQYYVLAASQVLLLLCSTKLHSLHKEVAEAERTKAQARKAKSGIRGSMRSLYSNTALDLEVVELEDPQSPYHRLPAHDEVTTDVHELLKRQPFVVRMFVREGGLLFGCVAAIVWGVSYPSYASAPMIGLAFVTLALYGLSSTSVFAWGMLVYGTCLSAVEYFSNLTIQAVDGSDYTPFGLLPFDYPILDIGIHNVCLVVIYLSLRMHWRYQDILAECSRQRAATRIHRQSSPEEDDSGEGTSAFLAHADIRNRIRRGGWSTGIQLWLEDAEQVFFTHLDALVLITILIVALSTQVSILQIGYLVLAVLLILFFEHRRRFWRILLLYALAACFAVFLRNVECKHNSTLELIGLECYSSEELTWKSLWPTLFSAQLLIIFELVFQLVIYVANKDTIEQRMQTRDLDRQKPLFFVSRLMIELDNWFRIFGVLFCYVAFIVVALQYEQGASRLSTTVIGGVQLSLCFILLGNHLGGFPTAPRTSLRLKLLWSIALLVEITILVSRYLYQFSSISSNLDKYVFTSSFMSAQDVGYVDHSSSGELSGLFVYLLPTTIVMSLCFWQLYSMMKVVQPYELFTSGQSRTMDWIRVAMDTVKQLMISLSATALVVVTMYVAIDRVNFIGGLYVLVIVLGRPITGDWRFLWRPLFWISACAAVLKYAIQLSVFNPDEATVDGEHVLFSPGDDSDWVGTVRLYERYSFTVGATELWDLLSSELVIMLMCFFQRIAEYWDSASSAKRQQKLAELTAQFELDFARRAAQGFGLDHRTSSCEADDDEDDNKDRFGDIAVLDTDGGEAGKLQTQSSTANQASEERDPLSKAGSSGPVVEEKDFLACLREFCTSYASKASVNVSTLLLTVACFVHQDVVSVVYMLVVYGMMYAYPSTVCRRWWAIAILLSLVIVLEYAVILWLPPFLGVDKATTPPWTWISDSYEQWFLLSDQHVWALMADFVALYSVYLLPKSDKIHHDEPEAVIDIERYQQDYAASVMLVDQSAQLDDLLDAETQEAERYAALAAKHLWFFIESVVVTTWLPLLLLLVFIFGTSQGGLVSIVYLWASMVMLYRLDEARAPLSPWIHQLRKFNWAHLFAIVLFMTPYVSDKVNQCLLSSTSTSDASTTTTNTTSSADDESDCMTVTNLLGVSVGSMPYGLIAMCVLISIQCEILASPTYPKVLALLWDEQERAPMRRDEIVRDHFRRRTAKWFAMKKDKSAAIQRLKMIVSKLVHKVEELMDIAMGLHHNLPPTAPTKPVLVDCSQNAATISWDAPATSVHKIRYYRISRQRYPSLTLLGDFSDVVEVKGSVREATIEGLRPGTAYQFKVSAVSRMGEGPFSVASDPISTQPLNLGGSSTAGWMKYRRESHPPSRWLALVAWLKPKFLHRYVVIDGGHLIYYRDEEMALKHRSRARRKRLKTSFKWRDVLSFRLSDDKVQFDDMSPSLLCLELVVRHSKGRGDTKYAFQPELAKEFNAFLSAVAFAVPRDALDDNVVDCLRSRKLPNPLDVDPAAGDDDGDANYDENKSEWSSVTGDESTLGDPEDHEFDENPNAFAWRIPLYNLLHRSQNAAFQQETTEYDAEDVNEPEVLEIAHLAVNVVRSASSFLACLIMVICFACQADLLNLVLVLAVFGYILVENPRPSPTVWVFLMRYVCGVLALRYVFQLSIFCTGMTQGGYYYPSVQPYCTSESDVDTNAKSIQPNVLLGLYKFDGLSIDSVTSVFDGLQWDFYVLLFILWHQRELKLQGFWLDESVKDAEAVDDAGHDRFQSEALKNFRGSFSSSRDSVDDAFTELDERQPLRQSRKDRASRAKAGTSHRDLLPPASTSVSSSRRGGLPLQLTESSRQQSFVSASSNVNNDQLAAEMLEELQQQEMIEEEERRSAAAEATKTEATDGKVAKTVVRHDGSDDEEVEKEEIVSEQVDEDDRSDLKRGGDDDEEDVGFLSRRKKSWLEAKAPSMHAYLQTVVCSPPAQWDKDIHAAITGDKPGSDYYSASLAMLLLSSIFVVVLFEQLGEPDSSDTTAANADSRLTSSDMISGYLVLLVFLELVFIIWDRVAYVCGSLAAKLALQYAYTLLLHLCVWWLIPEHTNIYLQQRPALVAFYAMQCVFLWCSALQLRDGYPVYRGSRYNYTRETMETRMSEKTFGLLMSAPFLFETRALLDYICTRTSLGWGHWVLLEDTAAHLYQVKLGMRGRAENADVLQGKLRQPLVGKLTSAGVMLLVLLVCLLAPLALFSSINPSTTENEVTLVSVSFGIEDAQGSMSQLYANSDSNSPNFAIDRNTDGATVQRVEFDVFSHDAWAISPPRLDQLVEQLQGTAALNWTLSLAFERPGPTDYENVDASYSVAMTPEQRNALIPMLKQTLNDDEGVTLPGITVTGLFPPIVQLTAKNGVLDRSTTLRAVNVTKHSSAAGETWWTLDPSTNATTSGDDDEDYCASDKPLCVIAVSDKIVQGLSTLGVDSYGLTAAYVFVVVTIGSAVKGFFRGALFQIQYAELPEPDDVLELVEGVYIAREEQYVGHLTDEVRLFETLVRVLRSPETLLKITGTHVLHIPAAKDKLD